MKTCRLCKLSKPLSGFYTRSDKGIRCECIACGSESSEQARIKRQYGIEYAEYQQLYDAAGGVCQICQQPESSSYKKKLCLDHCHETGKIRGIICSRCNSMLSLGRADPQTLLAAADYLRRHGK